MIYKVTIEDKNGNVTDVTNNIPPGFSENYKLNESLDVGSLTITHITREEPYNMFDVLKIQFGSRVQAFRISADTPTIVSKRPTLYKHEVSLVEPVKILEREIVNGFTVHQPTDESFTYTLYDVAERLRKAVPLEKNDLLDDTRLFVIPSETKKILEVIVSPEFTWNNYTLRQCLDELCSIVDGIAKLDENGNFTIQFFNETYDLIGSIDETFNDKRRSQDIEFYATNLEINALNLVNDNEYSQSVEIYPANGYTTIRSDDYYLDFLKSYIPTPKKIYINRKLSLLTDLTLTLEIDYAPYSLQETDSGLYALDLSDRIVEKDLYRTLPTTNSGLELSQYSTLWYEKNKNNINISDTFGLFDTRTIVDNVIDLSKTNARLNSQANLALAVGLNNWVDGDVLVDPRYQGAVSSLPSNPSLTDFYLLTTDGKYYLYDGNDYQEAPNYDPYEVFVSTPSWIVGDNPKDYLFQIEYVPITTSSLIDVEREDVSDVFYKLSILSNQQARIIDFDDLANRGKGKINRIGNEDLSYSHLVTTPDDLFKLGDYTTENYIVSEVEYIYFKDYIIGKYSLTKNFNRVSKFIGVNSEVRQWEISTGEQTLTRNLKYKDYCEINIHNNSTSVGSNTGKALMESGKDTILETLYDASTLEPVRAGYMVNPYSNDVLYLGASSNGSKADILHFEYKTLDNVNVGNRVVSNGWVLDSITQDAIEGVRYTDEYGRLNELNSWLVDNITEFSTLSEYVTQGKNFPIITISTPRPDFQKVDLSDFPLEKDGGEILKFSYQVDFIPQLNKVLIGEQFTKRNRLISENPLDTSGLQMYYYDTLKLNNKHKLYAPTPDLSQVVSGVNVCVYNETTESWDCTSGTYGQENWITIDKTNNRYLFTFQNQDGKASWALVDSSGRTVLAVNQDNNEAYYNMTFDFKHFRTGVERIVPSPFGGFDGVVNTTLNFTYTASPFKAVVSSFDGIVNTNLTIDYTASPFASNSGSFNGTVGSTLNLTYSTDKPKVATGGFSGNVGSSLNLTYSTTQFKSASGSFSGSVGSSLSFTYDPCWTECSFDVVDTYFSATDETTNEGATCGNNVEKTICVFQGGGQWLCTNYIGVETTQCP